MTHLVREPIDLAALLDETRNPGAGALVVFEGTVRDHNEGTRVTAITYTAHEPLAEAALAEIEAEARASEGVVAARVVHRLGTLSVGESSVAIVVRAAHRAQAFAACRAAIEAIKVRVPIWKEEHTADGGSRHLDGQPLQPTSSRQRVPDA